MCSVWQHWGVCSWLQETCYWERSPNSFRFGKGIWTHWRGTLPTIILLPSYIVVVPENIVWLFTQNIFHGSMSMDQLYNSRPTYLNPHYTGPLRGLYLCGSGAHPGFCAFAWIWLGCHLISSCCFCLHKFTTYRWRCDGSAWSFGCTRCLAKRIVNFVSFFLY